MQYNLMIVDDEDNILKSIKARFILEENIEVITFKDANEALDYVKKNKIHILLTDIMMPDIDGISLLKKIKLIDPLIQVILMTGYTTLDKVIDSLSYGANDYLLKPFDNIEEVVKLISISIEKLERWKKIFKQSRNKNI